MDFIMDKKISVIMGIYNCADTLSAALDCIVKQTYTNWEVILCDDASTDHTVMIAARYTRQYPNRFFLLRNGHNMGLNYTLNRCLEMAEGEYIARMDGDDLCSPERFEKEIRVLENNPEISIVSTDMEFFDESGIWGRTHAEKAPDNFSFLKKTPFCHAACMVKKEAYDAVGGYSVGDILLRVEDYHLWVKMYEKGFRGINIQEPLYQMRDDCNALKRRRRKYRINEAYVKAYAVKHLHLPFYGYLYCMKPILIAMMPAGIYSVLHRKK